MKQQKSWLLNPRVSTQCESGPFINPSEPIILSVKW